MTHTTKPMMPIDDLDRLSAYLDDALSASERAELERRLQTETDLQTALNDFRATRALLRALPPLRAPRSFALTPAQVRRPLPLMLAASPAVTLASAAAALILITAGLLLMSAPSGRLEQSPAIIAAAITATPLIELAEQSSELGMERDIEPRAAIESAGATLGAADLMQTTGTTAEVQAPMMAAPAVQATQPVTEAMRAASTLPPPTATPLPSPTPMPTPTPAQPVDVQAESDAGSGLPLLIAGFAAAIIAALSALMRSRLGRS